VFDDEAANFIKKFEESKWLTTKRIKEEYLDKIDWRVWECYADDVGKFPIDPTK
jgi:hypothetical protein